jgi:hypothetical protein
MPEHARPSREEQAAREVGHTTVRPWVAWASTTTFVLLLLMVAAPEILRDLGGGSGSPWAGLASAPSRAWPVAVSSGLLAGNRELLATMNDFEDELEEASVLAHRALPRVQSLLTAFLGEGNEQVIAGREGWLYFRPAVDHLTGPGFREPARLRRMAEAGEAWAAPPQPDPVRAIDDFAAQLAHRGIGLVVFVTPVKASLHPQGLAPSVSDDRLPIENPSLPGFLARLAELEIPAWSPAALLAEERLKTSRPQFLRTDTHWTPQAMERAAAGLAAFLRRHVALPEGPRLVLHRGQASAGGRGDLWALLRLSEERPLFPAEIVRTGPVVGPEGQPWEPDASADILVLGDSFTNVFSQPELGWGGGAGFVEQLAYHLQRPVDRLAVNAGGPAAARERLAALLAAGDERLAGKRLVVYQFSARELSAGDWRLVDLSPGAPPDVAEAVRRRPEQGVPARGWVAWESNRSGDWRIWTRRLEGSVARQLSPDEPDRQHCCAHVSPDGSRLVYLSQPAPKDRDEEEAAGDLRLVSLADGTERTLLRNALSYGRGHRAALWHDDRRLAWVRADRRTFLLDVDTGVSRWLTDGPSRRLAWLVDATMTHAVDGAPTFATYDAETGRVVRGERRRGCEPYLSHDGAFGFWVRGAGGPFHWISLDSGEVGTLLEHEDPRIPGSQRYAYFPMLSRDGRLLAFGASPGDHDHARSNYDVFVAPVDPGTLELVGRPQRLTAHPAVDRYPDVYAETLDVERWAQQAPPQPLEGISKAPAPAAGGPLQVRARLLACSRVPSLREISPYEAALIVCEWAVDEVSAGEPPPTSLRVAHWALRNAERQPIASAIPGFEAQLDLEPLARMDHLEGYPLFDTLPPATDRPLYYARPDGGGIGAGT